VIPPWVDVDEYPFAVRALDVGDGVMRYVDEGTGDPILMVHGTPTWSFLYRHVVKGLRDRHRCLAPDNLGFGLSEKPPGIPYRPQDQARRLARFVDTLKLKDLTLVVHDFGGPIGLAYALDRPENVRRLILFNTWMWSFTGDRRYERAGRFLGSRVGRFLFERCGFSANVLFRQALADRRRYSWAIHRHYRRALGNAGRHVTWLYAREVLGSGVWYDSLWQRRERLRPIPALLVWGAKDPAFGAVLPRWREVFAHAEVLELADVGHAPPEERGPELVPIVARFLDDLRDEKERA
jgi:haloalkane dehalogenase